MITSDFPPHARKFSVDLPPKGVLSHDYLHQTDVTIPAKSHCDETNNVLKETCLSLEWISEWQQVLTLLTLLVF